VWGPCAYGIVVIGPAGRGKYRAGAARPFMPLQVPNASRGLWQSEARPAQRGTGLGGGQGTGSRSGVRHGQNVTSRPSLRLKPAPPPAGLRYQYWNRRTSPAETAFGMAW